MGPLGVSLFARMRDAPRRSRRSSSAEQDPHSSTSSSDELTFYLHSGELIEARLARPFVRETGRVFRSTSFGMHPDHCLRKACIKLATSALLDGVILFVILVNCGFMLVEDTDLAADVWAHDAVETGAIFVYTAELLIKVVARGLLSHKMAYLRNPWMQIDCLIVCAMWLPILAPELGSLAGLRALRAVRSLRLLRHFPGMPVLIEVRSKASKGRSHT